MDEDVNLVLLELHCVGRTYGIVKLDIDVEEDGSTRVKCEWKVWEVWGAERHCVGRTYGSFKLDIDVEEGQV